MAKHAHPDDMQPITDGCGEIWELTTGKDDPKVDISYCKMTHESEKHYHLKSTEYYCITSGTGKVFVGEEVFAVRPGSVVQIPTNQVHYAVPDDTLELFVVNAPPFAYEDYIRVES